jgi:hypothetical protein
MSIDEAINVFRKMKTLPSQCHLNWLKENFNPILKQMDEELVMNWGCSNCVRNYMNMLIGWQDRKIKAEQQKPKQAQPKPKRKRKTTNARKRTK